MFRDLGSGNAASGVGKLMKLDMMERKVSAMAVWPFDMRILGRISVIACP